MWRTDFCKRVEVKRIAYNVYLKRTPFLNWFGVSFFPIFDIMVCNATHLGDFNHCEDVEIDILDGLISIRNIVTNWQCSFESGLSIGKLAPGEYITEYNDITYTFIVS